MVAKAPGLAGVTEPASPATWWRDARLWTVVASSLTMKLLVLWMLVGDLLRVGFIHQLHADLDSWKGFIDAVGAGARPFLEIPSEAPVLARGYYWLLAKLSPVLQPYSRSPVLLGSAILMAAADAFNAGFFYRLVRELSPRSALPATLVWICLPGALLLGPTHLDPLIITFLLLAYRLHTRGESRAVAITLSIVAGVTPFASWLFAAELVRSVTARQPRRQWLQALGLFVAVQILLHLPFLLAGSPVQSVFASFVSGLAGPKGDAASFAPDTALGLSRLWFGHAGIYDAAIWLVLATSVVALVRMRAAALPRVIVVLAIATMSFRPQAGSSWQLWLYPFLLLMALRTTPSARAWLLLATGALDLALVLANPFVWPAMQREIDTFDPSAALERGSAFTLVFTLSVLVKLTLLAYLLRRFARAPLPDSAPTPLTWPSVDRSAALAWLRRPAVALWLAAAIAVGQSLVTASATLSVPQYSDEVFHAQQVERFCRGKSHRRKGITTPLGYHLITSAIATWRGDCSREFMRKLNIGWGLSATFLAFLILQSLGARNLSTRTLSFHFLPILFPYDFFIYTDVFALVLMLLALYLSIHRYWTVAGFVVAASLAVRQTNALMLILLVVLAFLDTPRTASLQLWLKQLLRKSWSSLLGLAGFAIFVIRNHGIAIGDRASHPLGLHIGNLAFLLFLLAFAALPVNLERIWRERDRLVRASFGLSLAALYFAYLYLFKIENPYNEQSDFLRNAVVLWATHGILTKTLFFIPIALGFAALWTTPLIRRSDWIVMPILMLGLLPESLIEHRYAILPLGLWMLMRRDGSPFAESLTALCNLGVSAWLLQQVVSGQWGI